MKILHVNQKVIQQNRKYGENNPPLILRNAKGTPNPKYCSEIRIVCNCCGSEVGRTVYSPNKPLKCGARLWQEFNEDSVQVEK